MNPATLKTIYVASDHAGFEYKAAVVSWLMTEGYTVIDVGASTYDAQDDFPDYIMAAAVAVAAAPSARAAILFGGSGQGEAMAANRFVGVRATVYYGGSDEIIRLSREHNDANVLSIGARFVALDEVKRVVWDWLHLPTLSDDKYARRNRKIDSIARTKKDF
jgi:ribose 5-phosphate isomerase B